MTTDTDLDGPVTRVVAGAYFSTTDGVHLHIAECQNCSSRWFPPVPICSRCAATDLVQVDSGTTGEAYASTVVRIGPPGFPAPYVLSYVDIDGVRILAHTESDEALAPGTAVRLDVGQIGNSDGTPLVSYVVRPVPVESGSAAEGDHR